MIRCEGYSTGCVLVGLEAMDADPEKDGDMDGQKFDRLCDLLEKLLKMHGAGSEEGEDEDPEADYQLTGKVRREKPNEFGRKVIPVSRGGSEGNINPLSARDAGYHSITSRSRRQADAADFEASAARYHGRAVPVHGELPTDEHRAFDSDQGVESFDEAVARVRQEQIDRFTPKKRR